MKLRIHVRDAEPYTIGGAWASDAIVSASCSIASSSVGSDPRERWGARYEVPAHGMEKRLNNNDMAPYEEGEE